MDKILKPSSYNYSTTFSGETTLFFNFYTLALVALSPSESILAKKILSNPNQSFKGKNASELKKLFVDKGFVIDNRVNETNHLKLSHYGSRIQQKHLSLTIAPTISCNFNCIYCYENKKKQEMSKEVEEALIHFMKAGVLKNGGLSVAWYGGEPLLRLDVIESLSSVFIQICQDKDAKFSAGIVTNGYLLDGETVEKLKKLKVEDAQITLDGPADVHDKRRPLVNGGKTFKTIMENVKEASRTMNISIRMNIDESNRNRIQDFLEILVNEGLQGKVSFSLGFTYPYTDACSDISGQCLSEEDFSLLGLETALESLPRGLGGFGNIMSKNHWCMADSENAYAVTPTGGLVKCWCDMANPEAEVGHLLKPITEEMKENTESWRRRDPFELECAGCQLLPVCMGGCPYTYKRTGKLECHTWKHHLKESLCLYYYLKKREQESEVAQQFTEMVEFVKEEDAKREKRGQPGETIGKKQSRSRLERGNSQRNT